MKIVYLIYHIRILKKISLRYFLLLFLKLNNLELTYYLSFKIKHGYTQKVLKFKL